MADLSRGTVAFLFTDIEDSTRLWQRHPVAMPTAYARHDALLREAVAAHGGAVYKVVGDAFQVAFADEAAALAAALDAQRALVAEPWRETGLAEPLRIRMALHLCPAVPEGGDYRTPGLNRLGRLLGVGHGGQVLLSAAIAARAGAALPAGAGVRDLGERRLKGLPSERVYQLLHPCLPGHFPPLNTPDRRPSNLPAPPTPLIGRAVEVAEVVALLEGERTRLLTLTGPGGVGKTRLALRVAAELTDVFADGAVFVGLGAITDPLLVVSTVGASLGVREEAGRPLLETLLDHLRQRELLLLLDNCEQVLEAAPDVAELLAGCPGLRVLATSRARLRLRTERVYAVPPLGLPDPARSGDGVAVAAAPAAALFLERAAAVAPEFAFDDTVAPDVARICARLDGLPLAIELAAAQADRFGPAELLAQLEQRLGTLIDGPRDLPARQRTLRDVIAWSVDLLAADEQAVFGRLAVFAGGCTAQAAAMVAGTQAATNFDEAPDALVAQSLLRREPGQDANGESDGARYAMLETVREYGLERLDASGEAAEVRARHAAWCLALVEEADPKLTGQEQGPWLDRLEAEHDNLRSALTWAEQDGTPDIGLRITAHAWRFWRIRGHLSEGQRWLGGALDRAGTTNFLARSKALNGAGALAGSRGELEQTESFFVEALDLGRRAGDRIGVANVLNNLGEIAQDRGNIGRAATFYDKALVILRELRDQDGIAGALVNLGIVSTELGDLRRATELFEEALELGRSTGDQDCVALALANMGNVAVERGNTGRATELYEEALALWRVLGDRASVALALINLAQVAMRRGDLGRAAVLNAESLRHNREVGGRLGLAFNLGTQAAVAAARHQLDVAARLYGAAESLRESIGAPLPQRERAEWDDAVSQLEAILGGSAFAATWAAGRTLTLDEAIKEALAEADAVEPEA